MGWGGGRLGNLDSFLSLGIVPVTSIGTFSSHLAALCSHGFGCSTPAPHNTAEAMEGMVMSLSTWRGAWHGGHWRMGLGLGR